MKDDLDRQINAAMARGKRIVASVPRAVSVRFDAAPRLMTVALSNGCSFAFPTDAVQGLGGAPDLLLAGASVSGAGYALHWPGLDVDLSLPDLMAGLFGTKAWVNAQRAATAGGASSPAKRLAAKSNGAKGGRPRKTREIA